MIIRHLLLKLAVLSNSLGTSQYYGHVVPILYGGTAKRHIMTCHTVIILYYTVT